MCCAGDGLSAIQGQVFARESNDFQEALGIFEVSFGEDTRCNLALLIMQDLA